MTRPKVPRKGDAHNPEKQEIAQLLLEYLQSYAKDAVDLELRIDRLYGRLIIFDKQNRPLPEACVQAAEKVLSIHGAVGTHGVKLPRPIHYYRDLEKNILDDREFADSIVPDETPNGGMHAKQTSVAPADINREATNILARTLNGQEIRYP